GRQCPREQRCRTAHLLCKPHIALVLVPNRLSYDFRYIANGESPICCGSNWRDSHETGHCRNACAWTRVEYSKHCARVGRRWSQGGGPDCPILSGSRRPQTGQCPARSGHGCLDPHDIANAATWADKYRDSNTNGARQKTRQWHFVDIELTAPDLDQACFNHPALPPGAVASNGPAHDCVVGKIEEFAGGLANPRPDLEGQVVAPKFLVPFVGDVHQPLHASDDHDRGGNNKKVAASWIKAGNLHHYWDTEFVALLETDAKSIASDLIGHISKDQQKQWQAGSPSDWAQDSFQIAKADAYGLLSEPSA